MKILFLDLASNSALENEGACIAAVSDQKTEAIHFVDNRIGDSGVMPLLEEVLKEAGWTDRDLTHIACIAGPGGFTSLRLAVTLGNTYADQLGIPVAGVNLSDLYEARTSPSLNPSPEGRGTFIWLHSTKKTQLFVRSFGSDQWAEQTLISVEDLAQELPENASIVGEILPEHREAIAAKNPEYPTIKSIAEVLPGFLSKLNYEKISLAPWYGRGW